MRRIIIVGGGVSGHLVLINLLRNNIQEDTEIVLVEKRGPDWLGLAYSTEQSNHFLNVPAGNMSAFSDNRDHFADWLRKGHHKYTATSFVPRRLYRKYIFDTLRALMENKGRCCKVKFIQEEAVDLDMQNNALLFNESGSLRFNALILAIGGSSQGYLPLADTAYITAGNYYHSSWEDHLYEQLPKMDSVLIIGTGLTMVDTLSRLYSMGHAGSVYALSRHGLLPSVHQETISYPNRWKELEFLDNVPGIYSIIKKHIRAAREKGFDWRDVMDSLRPYTSLIWRQLPIQEKKRFMVHLRHYWDRARHRMPRDSMEVIEQMKERGQLKIIAGKITGISTIPGAGSEVLYKARGEQETYSLKAGVIINCTGPASNYADVNNPFVKNLMSAGILVPDELNLGITCSPDGLVIHKDGTVSECLFIIGAPAKGVLWETTAVPEIRIQAERLSQRIGQLVAY